MSDVTDNAYLRPKEVCELLNCTDATLRNWIADGIFPPPIRLGRNSRRWNRQQVLDFLADKARQAQEN